MSGLFVADEVAGHGLASDDIGSDGGAEVGAGDFEFGDFLVEAIDVELLIEQRHAAAGKIDDDKAEWFADGDDAAVEDVGRARLWIFGRVVGWIDHLGDNTPRCGD